MNTSRLDGYYETNMKLFPYTLVSMMEDTPTIKKIVAFEIAVDQYGADSAFAASEREFLRTHWATRNAEKDARVLCALALILQHLSKSSYDKNWTKIQFEYSYYERKKIVEKPRMRAIGDGCGLYFWFQNASAQRWSSSSAIEDNLLQCHKMMSEEADKLVQDFLKQPVTNDNVSLQS